MSLADEQPIAIAEVKHEGPVNFEKEVLPLLTKNCSACHNAKKSEGELVLETPATILKGGRPGLAVVAGKSAESLLLKPRRTPKNPHMPPPMVTSGGRGPHRREQLGLIKLWIDQGATGEVTAVPPIQWQPLPSGCNPILRRGRYARRTGPPPADWANQIFIYHVDLEGGRDAADGPGTGQVGPRIRIEASPIWISCSRWPSAHGDLLASGSYREVKLWRRPHNVRLRGTGRRHGGDERRGRQSRRQVGRSPGRRARCQIKLWIPPTFNIPKCWPATRQPSPASDSCPLRPATLVSVCSTRQSASGTSPTGAEA